MKIMLKSLSPVYSQLKVKKCPSKAYSTIHCRPVNLNSSVITGPSLTARRHMVFLHGLFGAGNNWRATAVSVSKELPIESHLLDARNHGLSPHSDEMSFLCQVEDLHHYLQSNNISKTIVLGHSMGGKTAMYFSQKYPHLVEKLIVVDVAPVPYGHYSYHMELMEHMKSLDLDSIKTRREAEEILKPKIQDNIVRGFLLQNLVGDPSRQRVYKWRLNLDVLSRTLLEFIDEDVYKTPFRGETLFVGGTSSPYIKEEYSRKIFEQFPRAKIDMIKDGNHYLHFEKQKEFLDALIPFLKQ